MKKNRMIKRINELGATFAKMMLCVGAAASASAATVFDINEPLMTDGSTFGVSVLPKSGKLIYAADYNQLGMRQLYLTDRRGGESIQLTSFPAGGGNGSYLWRATPDEHYLVYLSRQNSAAVEIFVRDFESGQSTQLNPALVAGGAVDSFFMAENSKTLLFTADAELDNRLDLYATKLDSPSPVRLTPESTTAQRVYSFIASPDGETAVFTMQIPGGAIELFTIPTKGGDLTKVNVPLAAGGRVREISFTPDGQRVLFTANTVAINQTELFSMAPNGSDVRKISPTMPVPSKLGNLNYSLFNITPDSQWVVYKSDHDVVGRFELFAMPVLGGTPHRLSEPRTVASTSNAIMVHAITKDGRIIFRNNRENDSRQHLFVVSAAEGNPTWLTSEWQGNKLSFHGISQDEKTILYTASDTNDFYSPMNLFAVSLAGGSRWPLNSPLQDARRVVSAKVSADNEWVVYQADPNVMSRWELFRVPLKGGVSEQVSKPMSVSAGAGRYPSWGITPDSKAVIYTASPNSIYTTEIYAATLPIEIPMDIKPNFCPNEFTVPQLSNGNVVVALPGMDGFDLNSIELSSIKLNGVSAFNQKWKDVTTPYLPGFGKNSPEQCADQGGDGKQDLELHFKKLGTPEFVNPNGESAILELTGKLITGGTVIADDVVTLSH